MDDYSCDLRPTGYGNPPLHTRFRKGRSGNPSGRPRQAESLASLLARELDGVVELGEEGQREMLSKRQAIARRLVDQATAGQMRAIKQLVDMLESEKYLAPEPELPPSPFPLIQARLAEYMSLSPEERAAYDKAAEEEFEVKQVAEGKTE
jgi:uncharacterized protein DUF5681